MTDKPINKMIDDAVKCVKCGAKLGECDCWSGHKGKVEFVENRRLDTDALRKIRDESGKCPVCGSLSQADKCPQCNSHGWIGDDSIGWSRCPRCNG